MIACFMAPSRASTSIDAFWSSPILFHANEPQRGSRTTPQGGTPELDRLHRGPYPASTDGETASWSGGRIGRAARSGAGTLIRGLDGLRALAVLLVIAVHTAGA